MSDTGTAPRPPLIGRYPKATVVAALSVGALVGAVLYGWITPSAPIETAQSGAGQGQLTMWTCSMHPNYRSDKPGKCPNCGMDLIPVAISAGGMRTVSVSPEARALMNVEISPVERRYVTNTIPMVGKVTYDETRLGYITAWVPGRLDRLYVDNAGIAVNKGDHLVYIYSPELYAAQADLIQARRFSRERSGRAELGGVNLIESARDKLRLLGLTDLQISEIEQQERPSDHLTINAPMGGIVVEKLRQVGDYVQTGERIYTVADLSEVWVILDAYESDLEWIRYGQQVTFTTEAYPGEVFVGRISLIQPVLNDRTRTVKVRVYVPNPAGKLKPEMFIRGAVQAQVADGGRVVGPDLAGKWICPMHPEVVETAAGTCRICGMDLVTAESLGFVATTSETKQPPLVIPYSAALVTGKRAIVYVELPNMHSAAEPALKTLSAVVDEGDVEKTRDAFAKYAEMLERPYNQPGTGFAQRLWSEYADRLVQLALNGQRVSSTEEAADVLAPIESTMNAAREQFAPPDQPTYEGREIVLGPRAGAYYLVRHGLAEGELVVTQGNFKIDAEIQIQAKPSMMTPEGGGGGGHQHGGQGGGAAKPTTAGEHAEQQAALPAEFDQQVRRLEAAYDQVADAIRQQDLGKAATAFGQFGETLNGIDGAELTGHPRMLWKEFAMLLGNDAIEGSDAEQLADADHVFLLLKGNMRRMREQLGIMPEQRMRMERIVVDPEFQVELARVWEQYRTLGEALATDRYREAQQNSVALQSAMDTVDAERLTDRAKQIWTEERAGLVEHIASFQKVGDIQTARAEFALLSERVGVLARTFGFGEAGPVYELHCPMALEGKGAVWYQASDQVRNPYMGSALGPAMFTCADRVEKLMTVEPANPPQPDGHQDHSQHEMPQASRPR